VNEKTLLPQPEAAVTVLDISPNAGDHAALVEIFQHSNWILATCRTCAEAIAYLKRKMVPVIVCERDLPDGGWQDILERTTRAAKPPALIVTSRLADERLWADVLDRGGYNVLLKPYQPLEVLRDIGLAWQQWRWGRERPRTAGGAG